MHVLAEVLAMSEEPSPDSDMSPSTQVVQSLSETRLREGELFEVPNGKSAALSLVPGIFAVAHSAAELQCDRLIVAKDGNETGSDAMKSRDVSVQLRRGQMSFWIGSETGAPSQLEVIAGNTRVVAGVGALFHITRHDDRVSVACVRGSVDVGTGAAQIQVPRGQYWLSGRAEPQAAGADSDAQQAIERAAADERTLLRLVDAKRSATPAWRSP
ncbi:MAG: hypothetical protein ACJ8KU_00025 [Chthoniobacterales bacterium]